MKNKNNVVHWLIMITLAVVPLVFYPSHPDADFFYYPKVLAMQMICLAYVYVLFRNRKKLKDIISIDWINLVLLIYLLLIAVSTMFSMDIMLSIYGKPYRMEGITTIILYFLLFLIARQQGTISRRNVYWMLFVGMILVLYGIAQYYGFDPFPRDFIREEWQSTISTIGNPNFVGSYIVLLLPFTAHLFLVEKRKFGLIGFAILFYGLLATLTRGAWVGAFISIGIYGILVLILKKKFEIRYKDILLISFVAVTCLVIFDISSSGSFISRFLMLTKDISEVVSGGSKLENVGTNRVFIWMRVIELIKNRPLFGYGLETLHLALMKYASDELIRLFGVIVSIDRAHNEYLHIAVSSGIPALIAYLGFIILIIRKGITKILNLPYAIPLLVSIIGYLIQAFFNISVVSVAYIFWVFLGFTASSKVIENDA